METPQSIRKRKNKRKITVLTAYDYWSSLILSEAGIDIILVGDSLGMVMLGYKNTLPVTMEEMLHHTKAVSRACSGTLVAADMPFMSDVDEADVVRNAGRFLKEAGAHAVKLEGGAEIKDTVKTAVSSGIPVMGHIGLTPQDVLTAGGYKRQDNLPKLLDDARALEDAGAFCIVLECVRDDAAKEITEKIHIPTIGIGSGVHCDGQVLVLHDLLGMCPSISPKFVRPYARLKDDMLNAVIRWKNDIDKGC